MILGNALTSTLGQLASLGLKGASCALTSAHVMAALSCRTKGAVGPLAAAAAHLRGCMRKVRGR